ncbi:hypothetical protein, partial [Streptococcus suis]|uniref:hypothetical protein n=1 Tax=Streptococcus suis TaxID=1307 RepID=UPI0037A22921
RIAATGAALDILVDVDTGSHRTGAPSAAAAVSLARSIADSSRLRYRGVQYYCGTLQHIVSLAERRSALAERTAYLGQVLDQLRNT